MHVIPLVSTPDPARNAKWAFSTRRVPRDRVAGLGPVTSAIRSGDVILGRVDRIGSHRRIQLASGRPAELYEGDFVVLACGARYAPDQFEGVAEIDPDGTDMLAGGGVLGRMRARHARMATPTRVVPLGLLRDDAGAAINLADHALAERPRPSSGLTVIGAVGASMNAGKTTAVASLAHGLVRAGYRVAALKATGTGAFGDFNAYVDSGAQVVADFVDTGMVSTYGEPLERIETGLETLLGYAGAQGCEVALIELADGVFQAETAGLLRTSGVRDGFDGILFAAPDAASAVGGCAVLRDMGIEPDVVTGMVGCSPLATLEAESAGGVRIVTKDTLADPAGAGAILAEIRGKGGVARKDRAA